MDKSKLNNIRKVKKSEQINKFGINWNRKNRNEMKLKNGS